MNLREQLERDEGIRRSAYRDTRGFWTTGMGHKVSLPDQVWMLTATLTDDQINVLADADVADKERQLNAFTWYVELDECRRAAVCNMAFNMGLHGLLGFPSMIHYLHLKDWENAAIQCDSPHWRSQVGARVDRIAEQIRTGTWQ